MKQPGNHIDRMEFRGVIRRIFRLEYDACRTEIQFLSAGIRLNEKQEELEHFKDKYEQLKCSVNVKLRLLDENQVDFS